MKHVIRFAVATLVALPLLAADLGKYNDWDQSPQGYFMTKAEREQWERVDTAAAAEKFVAEFLDKGRGYLARSVSEEGAA